MNHTSDRHPLVPGLDGPSPTAPTATGTCGPTRAGTTAWPAQAAQQLGLVVRGVGLDVGRRPGPVLLPQVPGGTARPQLAKPGGPEAPSWTWFEAGSTRGVDGFRLDVFNVFYKDAGLRSNPAAGATARPGTASSHLNDQNQPELRALPGPLPGRGRRPPGTDDRRRALLGGAETAATYATDRHLIFDFVLLEQPWSARAFGAAIERDRAGLRAGALAGGRPLQP